MDWPLRPRSWGWATEVNPFTVLYDACVLYPAPLRDLLMRIALVTNFEDLIPSLVLPDADDRHVLAAAIRTSADLILTFNIKDFPAELLRPYGIEACHPDPFLVDQLDLDPQTLCLAARLHRASLRTPPKSVLDYLATFNQQGLPGFAARLEHFSSVI
jgi:hypothetical protein